MTSCYRLNRRQLLTRGSAFAAWSLLPAGSSLAAAPDPRLMTIVLRGALDGLATVMPVGDPDFYSRRSLFMEDVAKAGEPLALNSFFALSPHLKSLHDLYRNRQALFVHAIASPYRSRSHFDGQDILESGLGGVSDNTSGWLNRALGTIASSNQRARTDGLFVGASTPLIMRGEHAVMSYTEDSNNGLFDDTQNRLLALYQDQDPVLASALQGGIDLQMMAEMQSGDAMDAVGDMVARDRRALQSMIKAAGLMAADDGPRIAAMSLNGWDTHAGAAPGTGQLARRLQTLDTLIDGLRTVLAPVWEQTTIVITTEFGRTVDINGTAGTDHGTGTSAILIGGGVAGGRVLTDWPGLSTNALYDGRDLMPTVDMRSLFKSVLRSQFDISDRALAHTVFPDSAAVPSLAGLMRTG